MKRILVVEDDKILNKTLTYNLRSAGYEVDSAVTAAQAGEKAKSEAYQLVVLDVNLPDGNGYEICRQVKKNQAAAVIFVTANDMESDMLKGYELGADDYVTKPFSVAVFQKKVAAILGRMERRTQSDRFFDGHLEAEFQGMHCLIGGSQISLSPKEWKLLRIFVHNKNQVLTRQILLEKLWDIDGNFIDDHTLTTTLSGLRKKIEDSSHSYIQTVYGMGYMWTGGEDR